MAVKQTSHLIPMCHPLMIQKCSVDLNWMKKILKLRQSVQPKRKVRPVWRWRRLLVWECGTFDNL